jgi:hypothetical protein
MACSSHVPRLGLLVALATAACVSSSSETESTTRFDAAATPGSTPGADGAVVENADADTTNDLQIEPDATPRGSDGSGDVPSTPAGKFKPGSGDFGSVAVGQQSEPLIFNLDNDGDQPTGPLAIQLGGSDAASFLIVSDSCKGTTVPAAGSCAVTLRFKPVKAGELAGSLTASAPMRASAALVFGGTGI